MVYEIHILSKGSYSIFDSNDTLACDDDAHKVILCAHSLILCV